MKKEIFIKELYKRLIPISIENNEKCSGGQYLYNPESEQQENYNYEINKWVKDKIRMYLDTASFVAKVSKINIITRGEPSAIDLNIIKYTIHNIFNCPIAPSGSVEKIDLNIINKISNELNVKLDKDAIEYLQLYISYLNYILKIQSPNIESLEQKFNSIRKSVSSKKNIIDNVLDSFITIYKKLKKISKYSGIETANEAMLALLPINMRTQYNQPIIYSNITYAFFGDKTEEQSLEKIILTEFLKSQKINISPKLITKTGILNQRIILYIITVINLIQTQKENEKKNFIFRINLFI